MKAGDARRFAWLLRTYVAPYWPSVGLLIATSYLATAIAALPPLLMAPILDLALGNPATVAAPGLTGLSLRNLGATVLTWARIEPGADRMRVIAILCGVYVAVGFLRGWADFGNYLLALWIRVRAHAALQADVFRHLLGLSMSFFTRQRGGELVSRLTMDTHATTAGLEIIASTLLTAPFLIAFYGYLMVKTSPILIGAAVLAALLHYGLVRLIRGPIRRFASDQFSVLAEVGHRFQEAILSIRVVKSFGAEKFEAARAARALHDLVRVNMKFGVYKHVEEPARTVVSHMVEAGILLLAIRELLAGRLPVPTFFLLLYVGRSAMLQVAQLAGAYTQIQATLAASGRVAALFAETPKVIDGIEEIAEFRERIALHDVGFAYDGDRVLDDVSFDIPKGSVVALVGPSGAGKSTLADLILRFYDPDVGHITVDGRDIRTLRQDSFRQLFGVVPQEALLINGSVRDNIAYGREHLPDADVEHAARLANAHEFIMELPQGYATQVGDRGIRLSGGQRQRIALARALVGRPQILVLDEATSSLDSESEKLVQEAIERAIVGSTSIVIAHRLSTVLHADQIVVVNERTVEAVGTHQELLERNPTYARLYQLQFEGTA